MRRFGQWLEAKTIDRLPVYRFVKTLAGGLIGSEAVAGFKPALLISQEGDREFAYVVEDHGNGQLTIMVPWAPTAFSGSVKIVAKDRVQLLDAGLGQMSMVLNHLGLGGKALMNTKR